MSLSERIRESTLGQEVRNYLAARQEGIPHDEADRSRVYCAEQPGGDLRYVGEHIGGYAAIAIAAVSTLAGAWIGYEHGGVAETIASGLLGATFGVSGMLAVGCAGAEATEFAIRIRGNYLESQVKPQQSEQISQSIVF